MGLDRNHTLILTELQKINSRLDGIENTLMKTHQSIMKWDMADIKAEQAAMKRDIADIKVKQAAMEAEQEAIKQDIVEMKAKQTAMKVEQTEIKAEQAIMKYDLKDVKCELRESRMLEENDIHKQIRMIAEGRRV